jgi:hypothetical protein
VERRAAKEASYGEKWLWQAIASRSKFIISKEQTPLNDQITLAKMNDALRTDNFKHELPEGKRYTFILR